MAEHNMSPSKRSYRCFAFSLTDDSSLVLSIFYGIFVVSLAIVFIVSQFVAFVGPLDVSEYYLNCLYLLGILWFVAFGVSVKWGRNRHDVKEPVKSHHASNRWLKGVVAIFGFSVILKNALELFAITKLNPLCEHKTLHILNPILHSPFIFGQVMFIYLFLKHYLQEWRHFARFGIIHIIATNFSVWLQTIAGEATEAMEYETNVVANREGNIYPGQDFNISYIVGYIFRENCTCSDAYCKRVYQADKFLFPFLIEYCLISTCLLYFTWKKVGKKPKSLLTVYKPCYKFYKAYKGPTFGAVVLASTVTVIVLLGASDQPNHKATYLNHYEMLHLYESFLTGCEFLNLLVCLAGFYLYSLSKKRQVASAKIDLDVVLLFVCFVGPLIAGLFSIFSLTVGPEETKAPGWGISLLYPIIDVIGTMVQIIFIIYGMQRTPSSAQPLPTRSRTSYCAETHLDDRVDDNGIFRDGTERDQSLLEMNGQVTTGDVEASARNKLNLKTDEEFRRNLILKSVSVSTASRTVERESRRSEDVEKTRLTKPGRRRMVIRELLMFLVISNASLWIFLSLDKTVFSTLAYQYDYFGHGVWTTITAITTPLSIFLRMHSAACFFEMWAYT